MASVLQNLAHLAFVFFVISMLVSTISHGCYIRPIALKLRKNKNFLSRLIWFSGQELSDYWDVEKVAKAENDQRLLSRLKLFRYSMYLTVFSFVLFFLVLFVTLITNIIYKNSSL